MSKLERSRSVPSEKQKMSDTHFNSIFRRYLSVPREDTVMKMSANFNSSSPRIHSVNAIFITDRLNQERERFEQQDWKKHCIYRVPWCLKRGGNDKYDAFRPRLVSIGPYHYGDPDLEGMQFHKLRVLHCILNRTGKDISEFCDVIRSLEHEARACYEDLMDETSFPSEMFVEMLLLDGCFILEFLASHFPKYEHLGYDEDDPVFSKFHMRYGIWTDLLLLENQIPLFVLHELHQLGVFKHQQQFSTLIIQFNSGWVTGKIPTSYLTFDVIPRGFLERYHTDMQSCLEVFWQMLMCDGEKQHLVPRRLAQEERVQSISGHMGLEFFVIPSVTTLKEAGIKFKCKNTLPFWSIDFKGGVLEIPQIMIHEFTESMFINLMAFELRHADMKNCKITAYVLFMDSLVNSAPDVAELRAHRIIISAGPSDEQVAELFNRLGKRVFIPFHQFEDLSLRIYDCCNKRSNRWRANLMHNYFNGPWAVLSVIAAVFLLLLTILQTSYSIAQYYQK